MCKKRRPIKKKITWIHARAVLHQLAHGLDVPVSHGLGVRELLGEPQGNADLGGAEVRVGRDDGTARVVYPLAHHVLSEQALLLFQHLFPEKLRILDMQTKRTIIVSNIMAIGHAAAAEEKERRGLSGAKYDTAVFFFHNEPVGNRARNLCGSARLTTSAKKQASIQRTNG